MFHTSSCVVAPEIYFYTLSTHSTAGYNEVPSGCFMCIVISCYCGFHRGKRGNEIERPKGIYYKPHLEIMASTSQPSLMAIIEINKRKHFSHSLSHMKCQIYFRSLGWMINWVYSRELCILGLKISNFARALGQHNKEDNLKAYTLTFHFP